MVQITDKSALYIAVRLLCILFLIISFMSIHTHLFSKTLSIRLEDSTVTNLNKILSIW